MHAYRNVFEVLRKKGDRCLALPVLGTDSVRQELALDPFIKTLFAALAAFGQDLSDVYLCPHSQEASQAIRREIIEAMQARSEEEAEQARQILNTAIPMPASAAGEARPGRVTPQDTQGPRPSSYADLDPEQAAQRHGVHGAVGAWWAMIPRAPPEPMIDLSLTFTDMSHPQLCRLVHWTLQMGPEPNEWWEHDTRRRNKHHKPPYWHPSEDLVKFLEWIYQRGYYPGIHRNDDGDATIPGLRYSGYQYELAELVCHIRREAGQEDTEVDTLWGSILDETATQRGGRDPHRHSVNVLDSFLHRLPTSLQAHSDTYPGMMEVRGLRPAWPRLSGGQRVEEAQEQEVLDLADALRPSVPRKPKLPLSLKDWVGHPIADMDYTPLLTATEHYRDTGSLAFFALRRFSASMTRPDMKVGTDVRRWHTEELRRFLVERCGEALPRHGILDDDWDPRQQALADAVLHINHADERINLDWQTHIGAHLSKVVGFSPRRHEAVTLASFLVQKQATVPGRGLLQRFSVAADCGRASERPSPGYKTSKGGAWGTGDQPRSYHPGASSSRAGSSHQDRPHSPPRQDWGCGASSTRQDSSWGNRSWSRPYHQWRGPEQQEAWHHADTGNWATTDWNRSGSEARAGNPWAQAPQSDSWGWARTVTRQNLSSGTGDSATEPGASPPWRSEAAGWSRPRTENSPTHGGYGSGPPPFPRPGAVQEGPSTAPGYFVQQLQKISKGWSQTWARWRRSRPVPGGGFPTNDPTMVHEEAAVFVRDFALNGALSEWRERTAVYLAAQGRDGHETYHSGAGRGTRRGRDEGEGGWASDSWSARRRR